MSKKNFVSYGDAETLFSEIKSKLDSKQNALAFDNIPTANSTNPVKSDGVYDADEAIRQWTTAEAKSVSGNPITLTDGSARNAEGLSVTCNPKQNLHGYDHPWAGGAGKNKLPMTVARIKELNTAGTWTGNVYSYHGVDYTILTDADDNVTGITSSGIARDGNANLTLARSLTVSSCFMSGCPSGGSESTYYLRVEISGIYMSDIGSGVAVNGTLSNIWIGVINGKTAPSGIWYPQIESGNVKTTFEPYTNECPITGYTECVVDRDGKNILPNGTDNSTDKGIEFTRNSDGSVSVVGTNDGTGASTYVLVHQMMLPAGAYTLTGGISSNVTIAVRDGDVIGPAFATDTGRGANFTLESDRNVGVVIRVISGTANVNTKVYPMICLSSASNPTIFTPYSHDNATIAFGQTVYGVRVDFKTGKVTVTHANIASYNGETINEPWISSIDEYVSGTTPTTGAQVVYPLTTPIELTLTPAELELLKGYNYITTNGTTIALAYLPDSLLAEAENYVDAKIPPAPSSDGTYVLTCTVTSGTPAYSWESAT